MSDLLWCPLFSGVVYFVSWGLVSMMCMMVAMLEHAHVVWAGVRAVGHHD
jgi:hypothetical protein